MAQLLSGFPGLFRQEVDGVNFLASYQAMREAARYCREGNGPALVHARVIRPLSHSLSDDERMYKTASERALEAARDPVLLFPRWLVDEGVLDRQALQLLMHDVEEEVAQATEQTLRATPPSGESALENLYSPDVDPTSSAFSTPPQFEGPPETLVDAINRTLAEEMRRDSRIVVFGEDVEPTARIGALYRLVYGRVPTPDEVALALGFVLIPDSRDPSAPRLDPP